MPSPWTPATLADLKKRTEHILWIGGPTDAGKTTTAALLAEKYGLYAYHGDRHWPEHWAGIDSANQPAMSTWINMNPDDRWVTCTVEELTDITLRIFTERLPIFVNHLVSAPNEPLIIAEWYGFLPELLVSILANKKRAVWMMPDDDFRQASTERRGKSHAHQDTSDPTRAWHNRSQRDRRLAEVVRKQAEEHSVYVINVDTGHQPSDTLLLVEAQFGEFLPDPR